MNALFQLLDNHVEKKVDTHLGIMTRRYPYFITGVQLRLQSSAQPCALPIQ
jgi:hypothetical protein